MLYLYDEALAKDLERSFNPNNVLNPIVKVVDTEGAIQLLAQLQNDEISFPVVCLTRQPDSPIDKTRKNFTRMHKGVASVLDPKTNNLYYEKAIPIELNYELSILTTNTVDMDELVKELLFKYTQMYFLSFELPYECKRKVRFGITVDNDSDISRKSGTFDYLSAGTLYETVIQLKCEGAVLVSYTPAKLQRTVYELEPTTKGSEP